MNKLTHDLIEEGYLKNDKVIESFCDIRRMEFVPSSLQFQADANAPLPVGYGQTIAQPVTVAVMLEFLDAKEGQNILVIGSGSGWTTGLLANIVGEKGRVIGVERISGLCEVARNNLDKFDFLKKGIVEIYNQDGSKGYRKLAPYDRIIVLASMDEVPHELEEQLKLGGRMVVPVKNRISLFTKNDKNKFTKEEYPGFSF
ncbi:protein-L-isoaspartate O-methyltransferase, partial [Patescibacteria group bacterium]